MLQWYCVWFWRCFQEKDDVCSSPSSHRKFLIEFVIWSLFWWWKSSSNTVAWKPPTLTDSKRWWTNSSFPSTRKQNKRRAWTHVWSKITCTFISPNRLKCGDLRNIHRICGSCGRSAQSRRILLEFSTGDFGRRARLREGYSYIPNYVVFGDAPRVIHNLVYNGSNR